MKRASKIFSAEQRKQVEKAVAEAESLTSCEIVPVVATASGRYDRAEDIIGLWCTVIAALVIWWAFPNDTADMGSWSVDMPLYLKAVVMVILMVAAFIIGVVAGSRIGWLRRLFTPRRHLREETKLRAREIFFDQRVHHTAGSSGLLVYVSLFERTAVVLGDESILGKLGQPFIDRLCQGLTASLRAAHPTDALCETIAAAGKELAEALPRLEDDQNELKDTLILLD